MVVSNPQVVAGKLYKRYENSHDLGSCKKYISCKKYVANVSHLDIWESP